MKKALLFTLPVFCIMACSQEKADESEEQTTENKTKDTAAALPADANKAVATPTEVHPVASPTLCGKTYVYQPSDFDHHRFTLLFTCDSEIPQGTIFGPVPAEEHGLFYFLPNLDSIQQNGNDISFSYIQGGLYQEEFTLENYNQPITVDAAGASKARLMYNGTIEGNKLTLRCKSQWYDCYADILYFVEQK